jgi:hypothetical protein
VLTDDMADLVAQQEHKLVNRKLLDEFFVVVNLTALVNSGSRDGVVLDELTLHKDGCEERMLCNDCYLSAVKCGYCHD